MKELIRNARLGWPDCTENGKLLALLLLAILIFWFWKREAWNKYRKLFIYTTIMAVCCIFPITAAILMQYQTRFYDYQWIWGFVPVTIVISLAGTLLWTELVEKYAKPKYGGLKKAGITLAAICILYLCGRMGNSVWDADAEVEKLEETARVLEIITENGQNTDITLWAPQGIMEYARVLNGNVRMPYGRNMWDPALNAYSYETYGETEVAMYTWMSTAEATGSGVACADWILQMGVNHVLLPGNLAPESVQTWEDALGKTAQTVEGYYWLSLN